MTEFILLEDGGALLQETGDNLLLDVIPDNVAASTSIDLNNGIITTAKLTITYTGNTPILYMSADDGNNWEVVTSGVAHIFTNTGQDLRWKAEGLGTIITNLVVSDYH